jgi:hypothetical protein
MVAASRLGNHDQEVGEMGIRYDRLIRGEARRCRFTGYRTRRTSSAYLIIESFSSQCPDSTCPESQAGLEIFNR